MQLLVNNTVFSLIATSFMLCSMSLFFEAPITIVGQGLAGSLLAWALLQHGKDARIYAGE